MIGLKRALILGSIVITSCDGFGITKPSRVASSSSSSSSSCAATTSLLFRKKSPTCSPAYVVVLRRNRSTHRQQQHPLLLRSSSPNNNDDNTKKQEEEKEKQGGVTLLQQIDAAGLKLKPMAIAAKDQSSISYIQDDDRMKSILYTLKSCFFFSLFIIYRAYRGFFVILPAVFREVYAKMGNVVGDPFDDDDEVSNDDDDDNNTNLAKTDNDDVNPQKGRVRLRTTVTVSILATLVTISYVLTGAIRVLGKFFGTVSMTSSVGSSFEAAAEEVIANEGKMMKLTDDTNINGQDQ